MIGKSAGLWFLTRIIALGLDGQSVKSNGLGCESGLVESRVHRKTLLRARNWRLVEDYNAAQ